MGVALNSPDAETKRSLPGGVPLGFTMIMRFVAAFAAFIVLASAASAVESTSDRRERRAREAIETLKSADEAFKAEKWEDAIAKTTEAIESGGLVPENESLAYLIRGFAHVRMKNCAGAVPDFAKSLEIGPERATTWGSRAECEVELKQLDAALVSWNKAVELDAQNAAFRVGRGVFHYNNKRYAEAKADAEAALAIEPDNKVALQVNAAALEQLGQKAEALAAWRKLAAIDPENQTAKDGIARSSLP